MVEAAARAANVPRQLISVPSLTLNSPATSQTQNGGNVEEMKGTKGDEEVIPDSEEERLLYVDQIYYDLT
jgi:hypothetical protein